ncbi:prolipoprotein diacylglyceryl transferase [Peptostreptococcus equinus]|uniref:Phosphatidylglycerol--prolipoprotein diacylglyceryl transferase n=1 Tax=Peptostreptococcus equinus TaxID=3003601 RepID=A0ABY7JQG5_9FIRM|nr:prolipoprotein diacylglyceryl transferase [Peptostreptococcus sp. CBA3647]WAW15596.1 prolipoprotein diacylglyceryl transferase [Peptostreptococcus sp. CBA3647]
MDRIAFTIFGIDVMWYGILIAIGMILAVLISSKYAKKLGYDENLVIDLCIALIPIGVIGARVYYVIFNWSAYSGNIMEMINIRGGGLAIHGGILFGLLTIFIYSKIKKIDFFKLTDVVVLGLPLAQSIGRWGNFINGEAHGGPTNLPWGIMVDGQKVHPTFLYESISNVLIFILLFKLSKNKKYDGQLMVVYMVLYSIVRFFVEALRTDSLMFGPIKMAQFISILGICLGIIIHIILLKRKNNGI